MLFVGAMVCADTAVAQTAKGKKAKAAAAAQTEQTAIPQLAEQAPTTDFSDTELKQFVEANTRLMTIQEESEKAMLTILKEENLEVDKFNEFAKAHQEQRLTEVEAKPEEMAAFNKAALRMVEMQPTVEQSIQEAIVKDGMTLDKYQEIMIAYQQSPALQEKVHKMMDPRN